MGRERRAYVCPACAKEGGARRIFLLPGESEPPRCPVHRRPMERQPNARYHPSRT
jgi:hypothetical protein